VLTVWLLVLLVASLRVVAVSLARVSVPHAVMLPLVPRVRNLLLFATRTLACLLAPLALWMMDLVSVWLVIALVPNAV